MDSEALKARSFERIGASESDEMEIIEMGSLIKVREVSGHAPSIEDDCCTEDGAVVKFIDGMEVCPATPSSERDSMDLSCSDQSEEREAICIALTPLKSIFDPFAPAPEEFAVAPMKRTLKSMQIPHLRKLKLYDCGDSTQIECHAPEEDQLSELLYLSFFELIVSSQLQEISACKLLDQQEHSKYANTPLSLSLLTGIAETCPPAPKREPVESTKLDSGACRQLDFLDNMAG